jgi:hypothetical protein
MPKSHTEWVAKATKDISTVYGRYAAKPGEFVKLTDIMSETDIPADVWRDTLAGLYREQKINLVPQSNQRALTDDQRRYAFRIGGEDKHLISMRGA